jgi:hypothetical protein
LLPKKYIEWLDALGNITGNKRIARHDAGAEGLFRLTGAGAVKAFEDSMIIGS